MRLIDDNRRKVSLFLNTEVISEDGEVLVGSQVWKSYGALLQDAAMPYAEKRVRLSEVQAKMDYFIYEVDKSFADACVLCQEKKKAERKIYYEDLTQEREKELEEIIRAIETLLETPFPPERETGKKCRQCAYFDYCVL